MTLAIALSGYALPGDRSMIPVAALMASIFAGVCWLVTHRLLGGLTPLELASALPVPVAGTFLLLWYLAGHTKLDAGGASFGAVILSLALLPCLPVGVIALRRAKLTAAFRLLFAWTIGPLILAVVVTSVAWFSGATRYGAAILVVGIPTLLITLGSGFLWYWILRVVEGALSSAAARPRPR